MIYYFFLLFIIAVFGGIAYLIMRFFNKWTKNSKYELLFNTLIFIGSFFLVSFLSLCIFFSTVDFSR
ncbi:flagellar biogenesis protein FliO [Chryseobacterium sediminis]|uniref:Flagellar biogenesis protein FliO n=1 Tax=Chryseobacterium sediminis TaxID=1679494 RepID=A0ABR6PXT7_9FLAO|nr:flagellar biogenesis protein FliO [Chryseobacterium sediminis]